MMSEKKPLVVAIMGPTASGKTAVALEIARHIPSEIISVDSALVYRGMDIGTAKPSAEELASAPHHLIDIIEPSETYSVAQFRKDALRLIGEILARGKLPLLVGGTMLYFKGLSNGLDNLPPANPAIRAQLDKQATEIGWHGMHAQLATLDPSTAARLEPNDAQRVQRALEIIEITGQPMSELLAQQSKTALPFKLLPIALEPSDRSVLHNRIAQRFDAMLEDNALIDEVKKLRTMNGLHLGLPSMRCVGYRQTWAYLDDQFDFKTFREKGIAATRQLAKRQLTWLRAMPDRTVIDCLQPELPKTVLALIQSSMRAENETQKKPVALSQQLLELPHNFENHLI